MRALCQTLRFGAYLDRYLHPFKHNTLLLLLACALAATQIHTTVWSLRFMRCWQRCICRAASINGWCLDVAWIVTGRDVLWEVGGG